MNEPWMIKTSDFYLGLTMILTAMNSWLAVVAFGIFVFCFFMEDQYSKIK